MTEKKLSPMTAIAAAIDAHLKRFEADPKINTLSQRGLKRFYKSGAWCAGRYVSVCYVSFQGSSTLTKADAMRYLELLDGGYVGQHYQALLSDAKATQPGDAE